MAQRIEVLLIDDIDESEAAETVTFGLDGTTYEIDLNEAHAAELREALAPWVGHGRKASTGRSSSPRKAKKKDGSDAAVIREWATQQGIAVTGKGRIPADVREQYEQATA